jgi:integrase/recombinase XerD
VHAHRPVPDFVIGELEATPKANLRYWFWSGNGKLQAAVTRWQGRLKKLIADTNFGNGHTHRFRDIYAIELLQAGVQLERLPTILGHSNIKVTEKNYSP